MSIEHSPAREIVRERQVSRLTGKSRTTLWRDVRAGVFPAPVAIGPTSKGWFLDEVVQWQERLARITYSVSDDPE